MSWTGNYKRYGDITNSHDLLKFIALIIMIIDHIGGYFYPNSEVYRAIGRIGFPIWFFFAGYSSGNIKIFEKELVIGCIILIITDFIFGEKILPINALLTMMAIRLTVSYLVKKPELLVGYNFYVVNFIFLVFWVPTEILFEYGTTGIAFGLAGYLAKNYNENLLHKYYLAALTIWFIFEQSWVFEFNLIETIIMITGTAIVSYRLMGYKIVNYNFSDNFIQKTIRFLGRNTLYLYVIHISLFVALKFLINNYYI